MAPNGRYLEVTLGNSSIHKTGLLRQYNAIRNHFVTYEAKDTSCGALSPCTHIHPRRHLVGLLLSLMKWFYQGSSPCFPSKGVSQQCYTGKTYLDSSNSRTPRSLMLLESLLIIQSVSLFYKHALQNIETKRCVTHFFSMRLYVSQYHHHYLYSVKWHENTI